MGEYRLAYENGIWGILKTDAVGSEDGQLPLEVAMVIAKLLSISGRCGISLPAVMRKIVSA